MKTIESNGLPVSILTKHQVKIYGPKIYTEGGCSYRITAKVRYDDQCGNGHNSFSITADIYEKHDKVRWRDYMGGCCHDEIVKHFPELTPFIKWHLTSADSPLHYIANTVYHAGNRDCGGLLKGEFRQHTSRGQQNGGIAGVPNWVLKVPSHIQCDVYATQKPEPITLEWKAYGKTGEGKERDLKSARSCAVWPDATDDDLTAPGLEQRLIERHPKLMAEFKTAMESLGFVY